MVKVVVSPEYDKDKKARIIKIFLNKERTIFRIIKLDPSCGQMNASIAEDIEGRHFGIQIIN